MTAKSTARAVPFTEIDSWDEVPAFASEADEAAWWDTHGFSAAFFRANRPTGDGDLPAPRPRTTPVAIRFDADTLARLKALARRKHKGYQTMLKEFVAERLYEEEKREGILPSS